MTEELKNSYSPEIEDLVNRITSVINKAEGQDADTIKYLCDSLLEYAASEQSDELFALYYYAYLIYVKMVDDANIEGYAVEGMKYQKRAERYDYVVAAYRNLAEHARKHGDISRGVLFLYNAMDIAGANNLYYDAAMAADALSKLYSRAEYYSKAIELSEAAEEYMEMSGRWEIDRDEYPIFVLNKGYALLFSNRIYDAGKCCQRLREYEEYMKSINKDYPAFLINTFFANYEYKTGNVEKLKQYLYLAKERLPHLQNYALYLDDIEKYIDVMYEAGEKEELSEILDYFINNCRKDMLPISSASVFYKKRIEIAMLSDDSQTAYELGIELLSLSDRARRSEIETIKTAEYRYKELKNDEIHQVEMREKNEQLREGIEKVKTENEAKTSFISSMSHEIRTPINAVLGLDEMIIRESTEENVKSYAYDILNAGKNLLSIVNDILDFSKIEAGKMEIVPQEYDLNGMIRELVNLIMPRAKSKDLEVRLDIDSNTPSKLWGDDVRIKQVITNLLTNAAKYTEEGYIELSMGYKRLEDNKMNLLVSVKDSGIGMKEEELEKLFRPFERLDVNRNRTIEGTGLGMSIVSKTLTQMGSELKIDSVYGEGSTFSFVLLQEIVDSSPVGNIDLSKIEPVAEIEEETTFTAHRARLLTVDDTSVNLTVVKGLLKRTGMQVDTAESGEECLAKCKENKYDIILLDHRMPGMDGVETLAILQAEPGPNRDTPVVALTANAMAGIDEYYLSCGFKGYLAKPVNGMKLEKMILELIPESMLDTDEDRALVLSEEEGIAACGSEEVFKQVVMDTVDNENMIANELKGFIADKDIANYTIKVHALKNTARMIGAPGVSKEALYLEKCGDEGREDIIYQKEDELINHFHTVIGMLKEKYGLGNEKRPPIDTAMFKEMMEALQEFVRTFDFERADDVISEIKTYSLPKNITESFEKLGNAMYNYDVDNVIIFAQECLSKI